MFFRKVDDAELRMPSSADLSCLNVADQIGYGDWLSRSFRNGIQQDMLRERLAQIGDAPGVHRFIARRLVTPTPLQLIPEIPPR